MYNYLPLITIAIFEFVVVFVELGIYLIVMYGDKGLKNKKELNEDEVWRIGLKAIVVGNLVTFLIGMFVYLLIGGSL
jgi:hypothetical protein